MFFGNEIIDNVDPNVIAHSPRKCQEFRDMNHYGLSNDHRWNTSFIHQLLRLMMSFSLILVLWLRQLWSFMSIKSFVQTQRVGQVTADGVSVLTNMYNWHVYWPWPSVPLIFGVALKVMWPPEAAQLIITHVRLETRCIDTEKSIPIIDWNGQIDFILTISVIYGNTSKGHLSSIRNWNVEMRNAISPWYFVYW